MADALVEIGGWQAEAARCERLRAGIYDRRVAAELDRLACEYRARAAQGLARLARAA